MLSPREHAVPVGSHFHWAMSQPAEQRSLGDHPGRPQRSRQRRSQRPRQFANRADDETSRTPRTINRKNFNAGGLRDLHDPG